MFALVLASAFLCACKRINVPELQLEVLPVPLQMDITGISKLNADDLRTWHASTPGIADKFPGLPEGMKRVSDPADAQLRMDIDEELDLKVEGYELLIAEGRAQITGKDRAGLFYGLMSLNQLIQDARDQGTPLPRIHIRDCPALGWRAIHLDVKHHLEKESYYYALMDELAAHKINAVIVELEDKLAYERRPLVGSADAMSMEQWKALSDYALERNIRLSPLVQGLGHASFILKHDSYHALRDDPESDWAFNPLDEATYALQFDLYRDALEAFPHGQFLHVGGDEVITSGRSSGRNSLDLQLHWLNKVCAFAEEAGRTPIFWDDMPLKYADLYAPMFDPGMAPQVVDSLWEAHEHKLLEVLDRFPTNCIYMRWNYSSPQTYGNTKAMNWFMEQGLEVMGATAGQTRWVLMPQNQSNMGNIRSFALSSIEQGLQGLLLTLWDDDSPHFELYKRGILAFAEYSWSGERRPMEALKAGIRHRSFGPELAAAEFAFVDQLEHMAQWWNSALLEGRYRNQLRTMENAMEKGVIALPDPENQGAWSEHYALRLDAAQSIIEDAQEVDQLIEVMKEQALRNHFRLEVCEQVNTLIAFSAKALLQLQAYDMAQGKEERAEALARVRELTDEFSELRHALEKVYAQTRILNKPPDYILDQDHHHHLANQTRNFDWLFTAELAFLDKLKGL